MSCANPFDWTQQSNEHRIFSMNHYPMIYQLVVAANTYQDFAAQIQAMNPAYQNRYNVEYQKWYRDYGRVWERVGCIPEYTVGEHTDTFSFKEKKPTTRPFLSGLGAVNDVPPPPTGYRWCNVPPIGGAPITADRPVEDFFGWSYQVWASGDDRLYYRFRDSMTNQDRWACPPTSATTSVRSEVKKIQTALLREGFNPGNIDGLWGPKTCQAAYSFQRNELDEDSSTLTTKFFYTLGVSGLDRKYARACDKWYTGGLGPDPDFVPPATPLAVKQELLKLGYNVGPLTNVWDRAVCEAAFKFKRTVLGESDAVLHKNFFEKLGLAGTLDVRECLKYVAKPTAKPQVVITETEADLEPAAEEAKANLGWIAAILGIGAIGTAVYMKYQDR